MTAAIRVLLLFAPFMALGQGQSPFVEVAPVRADSLQFTTALPDFEAKDIHGRIWRPGDLRGKFTLVYVWHTFEARAVDAHGGPGRNLIQTVAGLPDLAELQRFYEKTRGAKNLQVLTFCSDYDYTHAPEYMKEAKYTFPVIADWKLMEQIFGSDARTFRYAVIGPDGRLSAPFRSWSFGRLLFELEAAARLH